MAFDLAAWAVIFASWPPPIRPSTGAARSRDAETEVMGVGEMVEAVPMGATRFTGPLVWNASGRISNSCDSFSDSSCAS